MEKPLTSLDWSLLQSFLAVAETGSLSAAARRLGASQPTVGRHIQALEDKFGTSLFLRQAKGMALSETGIHLVDPARRMAEAAGQMSLSALGAQKGMKGPVRVTASVFTATYQLPSICARLRTAHPDIEIELVANDASENLLFREADIAVRMYRPTQLDVVTRHLGDMGFGIYAAKSYIERRGEPKSFEELQHHDLIGYDRSESLILGMRAYGWDVTRDSFPTRTDSYTANWELLRAGCGIGFVMCCVADTDPDVVKILPDLPLPGAPVWLTAHEVIRRTPRVSVVWDALAEGLVPSLVPPGRLPPMPEGV